MTEVTDLTDFVLYNETMVNMNMVTHVKFVDAGTQNKPKKLAVLFYGDKRLVTIDKSTFLAMVNYR